MGPPPVTPSPHRFVLNKARQSRVAQPSPLANSHQFNSTPRFSFTQPQRAADSFAQDVSSDISITSYSSTLGRQVVEQDAIEDLSNDLYESVEESIEKVEQFDSNEHASIEDDDDDELDYRLLKRRRLTSTVLDNQLQDFEYDQQHESDANSRESDDRDHDYVQNKRNNDEDIPSSNPDFSSPPTTNRQQTVSTIAPRFVLPSTAASVSLPSPAVQTQTSFLRPPRFRPPDERNLDGKVSEPLPEAFSPRRRGQKYLVGGLASELQAWIVGLESSGSSTGTARDHPWVAKILIDDVRGGPDAGMTFVSGRSMHRVIHERYADIEDNLGIVKMILGGELGTSTGLQKGNPAEVGKMIGVKGPVWEVFLEGARWGVGANWEVLK